MTIIHGFLFVRRTDAGLARRSFQSASNEIQSDCGEKTFQSIMGNADGECLYGCRGEFHCDSISIFEKSRRPLHGRAYLPVSFLSRLYLWPIVSLARDFRMTSLEQSKVNREQNA